MSLDFRSYTPDTEGYQNHAAFLWCSQFHSASKIQAALQAAIMADLGFGVYGLGFALHFFTLKAKLTKP